MIAREVASWLLLAAAFALATWVSGWWGVPILAGVWGALEPRSARRAPMAAAAAATGWAALLVWQALRGPVVELAAAVGPILTLPGPLFIGATLAFAATVAAAAAATTGGLRDALRRAPIGRGSADVGGSGGDPETRSGVGA